MTEKEATSGQATITLDGTVQNIIPPAYPTEPEKAQIEVEGADHLYRELRIKNNLRDVDGKTVALKKGAQVRVTIEAAQANTVSR